MNSKEFWDVVEYAERGVGVIGFIGMITSLAGFVLEFGTHDGVRNYMNCCKKGAKGMVNAMRSK